MVALTITGLPPVPGSDIYWDGFNGFGIAGLLLLLLCCWLGPAARAGYSVHALRLHIGASIVLLAGVFAHALGLLLSNDVMIEYLKWRAPLYMHAGNLGFVLMLIVATISLRNVRRHVHSNFNSFRTTHRLLSVVIILLTGWHIIGSGYLVGAGHGLVTAWSEQRQFAGIDHWRGWLLALAPLFTTLLWWQQADRVRHPTASTSAGVRRATALLLAVFLLATASYIAVTFLPSLSQPRETH